MARGHIRERGDAWEIRISAGKTDNGQRKIISKAFHGTREDADKELTSMLRERDTGSRIDPSKTTLAQYLDSWLDEIQVEPKTLERYRGLVKHQIKPHLGTVILQELKPAAVKSWHKTLRERGGVSRKKDGQGGPKPLSDRTCLHAHRVLSKALKDAAAVRLITSNPATTIEQPKVKKKKPMHILKKGEPKIVLEALAAYDVELHTIAHLDLSTGMRRGEIIALTWPDIDLDRGAVRVERSLEQTKGGLRLKEPKTEAGRRTITIPAATVEVMRAHKVRQLEQRMKLGQGKLPDDAPALVFPALDGTHMDPDKLSKRWARACKALDLPKVDFHGLRHTHASVLIAAKEDIIKISRRLGHSKPSVTLDVYGHLFEQDDTSSALAISAVLG
jgi:integrase